MGGCEAAGMRGHTRGGVVGEAGLLEGWRWVIVGVRLLLCGLVDRVAGRFRGVYQGEEAAKRGWNGALWERT